jgi:hypothetical protein
MTTTFESKAALAEWANDHTGAEVLAFYNGLPGVVPVKKFESRDVAVRRIWAALPTFLEAPAEPELGNPQGITVNGSEAVVKLNEAEVTELINPGASLAVAKEGRAARKRKAAIQGATKKRKPKAAKRKPATKPRTAPKKDGGRVTEVLALVTRARGVSLDELMERFGWQRHTARGFMSRFADAYKGLESFKTDAGVRTYRLEAK